MGKIRFFPYGDGLRFREGVLGRGSRRKAISFFVLFFFILFMVPFTGAAGADELEGGKKVVNPHDFSVKQYCHFCHTGKPPQLSLDPVTTCTKCHMGNLDNHPVTKHPIGKEPRINVPYNFPLTKDGKMVCYTCHDPHNKLGYPKMLRVEYGKLCAACHVGY